MTLQSDEGVLRQVKLAIMRARSGGEPGIVGFACRYCAYSGESPEVVKAALPANVQVIDVLCSGKVDALYLLKAFEYGADGVFVAGCIVGECHNDKGNVHAGQRVAYVKKMLDDLGLNGARLEMFNTPPGECASLVEDVTRLASKVKELGASPVQPGRSN